LDVIVRHKGKPNEKNFYRCQARMPTLSEIAGSAAIDGLVAVNALQPDRRRLLSEANKARSWGAREWMAGK
jgi:hypothetical protein